ncbi:MAG: TlpA family protein disulfide reductase [Halobacteria archaeon]|nr:TlpA family protein disulfide reductase [Halobacteria archaeon]
MFLLIVYQVPASTQSGIERTVTLSSGEEISVEVFGKTKQLETRQLRILWIASTPGIKPRQRQVARSLAQNNMEVWLVDLAGSLFLPHSTQTLRSVPASVVTDLINSLSQDSQTPILIVSNSYGAIPTLRGIHAWQSQQPKQTNLIGAVLFSPNFFTHVPTLGGNPSFIPELEVTNVPVYIYQAAKNGNRWHLPAVLDALQQNATVYTEILPGVTSMFYDEDQAVETLAVLQAMPERINRAMTILARHDTPRVAIPLSTKVAKASNSGLDSKLKPYRGSIQPQPFALLDANGKTFEVKNFQGRVTLVNFWATWCPPCVEEIPSLNHLKQIMQGKAFQLISINYAESPQHIREFMHKVAVDFPVLVDPDCKLSAQWKVVAFPSTFVIGPDGKIHYGANAAIHWDEPKVIQKLKQLAERP